jgi:hypothetical protein
MTRKKPLLNQLAVELPLPSAVVGIVLIFASVVLFMFTEDSRRIFAVSAGLFFMLLAIWFTAKPFIVNTRVNDQLRGEVRSFLDLIRKVSAANESEDGEAQMAEVKAEMLECVDRLTTYRPADGSDRAT